MTGTGPVAGTWTHPAVHRIEVVRCRTRVRETSSGLRVELQRLRLVRELDVLVGVVRRRLVALLVVVLLLVRSWEASSIHTSTSHRHAHPSGHLRGHTHAHPVHTPTTGHTAHVHAPGHLHANPRHPGRLDR